MLHQGLLTQEETSVLASLNPFLHRYLHRIIIFCLKSSSVPLAQGLKEARQWLSQGFVLPSHSQLPV